MLNLRKGRQNHFKSSPYLVAWIDLLGYGAMLRDCNFDPTSDTAKKAVKRLEEFNRLSLEHSDLVFPLIQMNDGIAAWRELSFRSKTVTQDFLCRSIEFFYAVTASEKKHGFPGPRMVISTGIRMKMKDLHNSVAANRADHLIKMINEKTISVDEAIRKACNYTDYCNAVNALQANFAFTKAFLAEESGKNGGLPGNNIFIDMNIFKNSSIKCLKLDEPFLWDIHSGLETNFSRLIEYSREDYNKYSDSEIANTLTIAQKLLNCSTKEEVLERLDPK